MGTRHNSAAQLMSKITRITDGLRDQNSLNDEDSLPKIATLMNSELYTKSVKDRYLIK